MTGAGFLPARCSGARRRRLLRQAIALGWTRRQAARRASRNARSAHGTEFPAQWLAALVPLRSGIHGRDTLAASACVEPRRIRQPTDFAPDFRRGDYKARRGGWPSISNHRDGPSVVDHHSPVTLRCRMFKHAPDFSRDYLRSTILSETTRPLIWEKGSDPK